MARRSRNSAIVSTKWLHVRLVQTVLIICVCDTRGIAWEAAVETGTRRDVCVFDTRPCLSGHSFTDGPSVSPPCPALLSPAAAPRPWWVARSAPGSSGMT